MAWFLFRTMPRLYNLYSHKHLRKQLRNEATVTERQLWRYLKNDQLFGFRFRRQFGVGRYILDFYCPKLHLAIEIDGGVHDKESVLLYDQERQQYIESIGIMVVRFRADEVRNNVELVVKKIKDLITSLSATPNPPSKLRRGT